jgi:hypothetical protein
LVLLFDPADGGRMFLNKIHKLPPHYTQAHARRHILHSHCHMNIEFHADKTVSSLFLGVAPWP